MVQSGTGALRRTEGRIEWRSNACRGEKHKHMRCSFRARVHNGFNGSGKRQYLFATGRGNQRDADKALRELLARRDNGTAVQPKRITSGEWIGAWLDDRIADGKVGLRASENYRTILRKRIKPAIGSVRLTDLRAEHILTFKTSLVEEGLAPATVAKVLGLVRQSMEAAVLSGAILRNPTQGVALPKAKDEHQGTERRALTEEEIAKVLAVAGNPYDVTIRFALATGVRQSELLGARWADLDLEAGRFTVQQTIQHVDGVFVTLGTKTGNSRRMIELSPATVAMLKSHRATQNAERLRLGSIWNDQGLVFPAHDGSPQHRRIFLRDYRAILKASRIEKPETANWHSLRHTAASLWIKAGIDVFVVSRRLGHANPGFTMRVYAHLMPGQQAAAAAALDHLLAIV